jgi:hypothetical protein
VCVCACLFVYVRFMLCSGSSERCGLSFYMRVTWNFGLFYPTRAFPCCCNLFVCIHVCECVCSPVTAKLHIDILLCSLPHMVGHFRVQPQRPPAPSRCLLRGCVCAPIANRSGAFSHSGSWKALTDRSLLGFAFSLSCCYVAITYLFPFYPSRSTPLQASFSCVRLLSSRC